VRGSQDHYDFGGGVPGFGEDEEGEGILHGCHPSCCLESGKRVWLDAVIGGDWASRGPREKYRNFNEENTQSRVAKDHGVRKSGCWETVCLDTSVLVALLRGEDAALRRLSEEAERGGTVSTTAVNLCELYAGAHASRDPLEVGRIRRLVSSLDLLDLDVEAARRYGELVNHPALRRSPIGDFDLIIACIALSHGENVATRNVAHFERVPGLGTESW